MLMCFFPGLALTYILENSFKPESGSRPDVPKIGILITDGKSQDDVLAPAQRLRDAGIELFAIGMRTVTVLLLKAHMLEVGEMTDIFLHESFYFTLTIYISVTLGARAGRQRQGSR